MEEILRQLRRLDANIVDRLVEIYDRITKVGLVLLLALLINVALNYYADIRWTSIVVALFGTVVILYKAYDPWILLNPLGATLIIEKLNSLLSKKHPTEEEGGKIELLKKVLGIYNETILETILWFEFLSLIIGIIPMQGRVKAGLIVVLALISFKVASVLLKKPPIFAKIAYSVSLVIFFVSLCWAILPPVSLWISGYDPRTFFQNRPDREAIGEADEVLAETESRRRADRIRELAEIAKKKKLTLREKEEWEKLRNKTSLFGKIFSFSKDSAKMFVKSGTIVYDCSPDGKTFSFATQAQVTCTKDTMVAEGKIYNKCSFIDQENLEEREGWIEKTDLHEVPWDTVASMKGGAERKLSFYLPAIHVKEQGVDCYSGRATLDPGKYTIEPFGTRYYINGGEIALTGKEGIEIENIPMDIVVFSPIQSIRVTRIG